MAKLTKITDNTDDAVIIPALKAPSWLQGFLDFIREQGVVGLAVGLVLGVASKSLIDSLVNNIFNPVIGLLYGGGDFSNKFFCLKTNADGECLTKINYGQFANDFIGFVIIAAVVYLVVKKLRLEKLDKKKQ